MKLFAVKCGVCWWPGWASALVEAVPAHSMGGLNMSFEILPTQIILWFYISDCPLKKRRFATLRPCPFLRSWLLQALCFTQTEFLLLGACSTLGLEWKINPRAIGVSRRPRISLKVEDIGRDYWVYGAVHLLCGQELWFPWFRQVCSPPKPLMQICHVRMGAPSSVGGALPYVSIWDFWLYSRWHIKFI